MQVVELEALHQLLGCVLLALRLPNNPNRFVERVKDDDEAFEDVDALEELVQLELEALGDDLHPEVDEVPKDGLEAKALRGRHLGIGSGDQTGEIHLHVRLKRRVLVEVRHDELRVGVLLHFADDAAVVGAFVAHVEQQR